MVFNPDVQAPHRWLDQNGSYLAFLVYSNSSVLPTKADVSESGLFGHTSLFLQQHIRWNATGGMGRHPSQGNLTK